MQLLNKITLFLAFFQNSVALSFPDMIRHGYSSCSSCHVSPSGGGVLNSYGRSLSGELLSAFGGEKEARYYLPSPPSWLNYGGDVRYLNLTSETYKSQYHHHFLMEADFELSVSPVPGFTIVSEIGYFNVNFPEKNQREIEASQRRNYLLINPSKYFSFRLGRFIPNYGLQFADHTLSTRQSLGFGEGRESYNMEMGASSSYGEIFLTSVNGSKGSLNGQDEHGYNWKRTSGESGAVFKANYFAGRSSSVGVSSFRLYNKDAKEIRTGLGIHGILAPIIPQIFTLFEVDRLRVTNQRQEFLWLVQQGFEPLQGIRFLGTYEGVRSAYSTWRWGIDLFPIAHLQLSSEYQRRVSEIGLKTEAWIFLSHYYF